LAETGETSSGLNPNWVVPKPFFDRGGQGYGIISVKNPRRTNVQAHASFLLEYLEHYIIGAKAIGVN